MKKKEILKVPYRVAEKAGKRFMFTASAFTRDIKGTEHLFVEVYRNVKKNSGIPVVRIVFTKEDWVIYDPENDIWSRKKVKSTYGYFIWMDIGGKKEQKTFMKEHDQDTVWDFCKETGWRTKDHYDWKDKIEELTDTIVNIRSEKTYDNRRKRIKERQENTPDLPEDLEEWADRRMFGEEHFLYYKKHGRYADIACSACGNVHTVATKRKDGFEGMLERIVDPQNESRGTCPGCGTVGTWKAKGRMKGVYASDKYCFVGQPYKEKGAVIRYIEVEKVFRLEETATEKGTEMTGAKESYIITEIARDYLEEGKKPKRDFHKFSNYCGDFWDDCNMYGMSNISIKPGYLYDKTFQMLKGTCLQYSGAECFRKNIYHFNMMDYMERYLEYPQIEMLAKTGIYRVVNEMINGRCGIIENSNAKNPYEFFGIRKERISDIIAVSGDIGYLRAMKKEKRLGACWTDKELNLVAECGENYDFDTALRYTGMGRLTNKLEKYAGCKIPEKLGERMCGHAYHALIATVQTYFDYMNMRISLGYDMDNQIFMFPKDLQRAHDQMTQEANKAEIDKREMEVCRRYPNIRQSYRKLRNRYYYEDDTLIIRPARSAEEIVREGRALHHCVGGDNYLIKHNEGKSLILFLRRRETPDIPYITVEIRETEIMQWYGEYDRKPDKKYIDAWIEKYVSYLKEGNMQAENRVREAIA